MNNIIHNISLFPKCEDRAPRVVTPQKRTAHAFVAKHDIFGHAQHIHQLKMLVHHADAKFYGVRMQCEVNIVIGDNAGGSA